jgi:hypothetical protein
MWCVCVCVWCVFRVWPRVVARWAKLRQVQAQPCSSVSVQPQSRRVCCCQGQALSSQLAQPWPVLCRSPRGDLRVLYRDCIGVCELCELCGTGVGLHVNLVPGGCLVPPSQSASLGLATAAASRPLLRSATARWQRQQQRMC